MKHRARLLKKRLELLAQEFPLLQSQSFGLLCVLLHLGGSAAFGDAGSGAEGGPFRIHGRCQGEADATPTREESIASLAPDAARIARAVAAFCIDLP